MQELNDHSARAHALLSASSSHRWLNCPPSAVAAEAYPNEGTEFTREGTLAHEVAEYVARTGVPFELDAYLREHSGCDQQMIECAEGYRDYIQEQIKTDGATVLLEQRVDFSTWVPDGFGTADCIIVQDKTITVIDYKYGQGVAVDAKENTQMMLYALGALNLLGDLFDIETVDMHIYQPRINNVSTWSAAAADLLFWADRTVKRIAAEAAKGKGKYKAGAWCRFCPHAGRCRQLTKTCTEYVETHSLRVAVPVLAPHEVAEVLEMEPLVSLWLKRVKAQAMDTLLSGGTVPGFKVVEGKLGNRKWTDEFKVAEALEAAGYSADDYTETKLLSPAAMDKSLGKKRVAKRLEFIPLFEADLIVNLFEGYYPLDRAAEAIKDFE